MERTPSRARGGSRGLRAGVITSLSIKGAGGDRVVVHLDGERAFDLSDVVAERACLHRGETLAVEQQLELLREDEPYRARELALDMLARRDLMSGELASKLSGKGISQQEIERVIAWLEERGYVDDQRYAGTFIREKAKIGWGRQRAVAELTRKGMERRAALEAWGVWSEGQDVTEARDQLVELVMRKFSRQLEADPAGARKRISGFLARRGHDWETIAAVVKAVEGE